ncbi:MAG: hypothetical protein K2H38_03660, partial [Muribaculaceae bacterium]|nr:hypothetical protein [Muribaculaceae bacterium]
MRTTLYVVRFTMDVRMHEEGHGCGAPSGIMLSRGRSVRTVDVLTPAAERVCLFRALGFRGLWD